LYWTVVGSHTRHQIKNQRRRMAHILKQMLVELTRNKAFRDEDGKFVDDSLVLHLNGFLLPEDSEDVSQEVLSKTLAL
jgi:hypothetical protein